MDYLQKKNAEALRAYRQRRLKQTPDHALLDGRDEPDDLPDFRTPELIAAAEVLTDKMIMARHWIALGGRTILQVVASLGKTRPAEPANDNE